MFKDKLFWKSLVRLTIPVALQQLLTSSFVLADTLLVSSLGTVALSAVGMIGQWAFLMNMVLIGFCSATTVFVSQFWGVKQMDKIRHISGISMLFALGVSVIFTGISVIAPQLVMMIFNHNADVVQTGAGYLRIVAISYIAIAITNILASILRAVENVRLPMYASIVSTVMNIVLDYLMIFGKLGFAKMGVKGAAIATVISSWAGVLIIIIISVIQKNLLVQRVKEFFAFNKSEISEYIKKAAPVVLNEGMWGLGTFAYNVIFGNMGYEYFSALTIVRSFENIAMVLFIGICSAGSVMIGKAIGMGDIKNSFIYAKRFMIIVPSTAVFISALIIIFRNQLVGIFNMGNNVEAFTLHYAEILMLIYAAAFPLRMLPYLEIVAIFRSGGDTVTGAKIELSTLWALSVPATLISVVVFKVPFAVAFAIMYIFEDVPKNILCLKHYLSKKWIKPVTDEGKRALEEYINNEVSHE